MVLTTFISFFASLLSLVLLKNLAKYLGLIDKPVGRKCHVGNIPLVGGMSVFFGVTLGVISMQDFAQEQILFIISGALMVFIGVLDDKYDLTVRSRLIGQFLISSILIFGLNKYIVSLGDIFGLGIINLGTFGIIFTVLAVIGAINAFNMVDGIDGLLGGLSIVAFSGIGILSFLSGNLEISILCIIIITSLLPYLMANLELLFLKKQRVFMGDAGSMFIGLMIIWLLVDSTQSHSSSEPLFRPVIALFIIALPLMDMVAIMFRRVSKGQSPFKPDREHMHHIFMRAGFTSRQALIILVLISFVILFVGIICEILALPESLILGIFILLFLLYLYMIKHAWKMTKLIKKLH